jgi:hypothetical protein
VKMIIAAIVPLSVFASPVAAQVYKCKDDKGRVTFQEAPCDGNRHANQVNSTPAASGIEMPRAGKEAPPDVRPANPAAPPPAAAPDASQPKTIRRTPSQIEERRFISAGMDRAEVLLRLGEPDRRINWEITYIRTQQTTTEPYVDVYEPAPGDEQTRTKIKYVGQLVNSVQREPVR